MIKSTTNSETLKWLLEQPIEVQFEALQSHLNVALLLINSFIEEEVRSKAGPRYKHDTEASSYGGYSRYGSNPGSIRIGDEKLGVQVPRLLNHLEGKMESPEAYRKMRDAEAIDSEQLSLGILKGLSTRDYGSIIDQFQDGFGLSKSAVSRQFIEQTSDKIKEFESRQFHDTSFVALFIDGKHLARQQMIIVLGITEEGRKIPLGLVQSASENSIVIEDLFENLIERGLQYKNGLLFIIDGSKGLKKAIEKVFGKYAFIQRCIWHKRENIMQYLPKSDHDWFKSAYHQALDEKHYEGALRSMNQLHARLHKINIKAAASLEEGMQELLTIHKLNLKEEFSKSFSTTNCIESLNSNLEKYIGKVKHWGSSDQRFRWVIAALMIIENRMWKVVNYKKLYLMQDAMQREIEKRFSTDARADQKKNLLIKKQSISSS
jgi:transposase-like protein